jgi:dynein heavy chain
VLELIKANKENKFSFSTQPQSFVNMIVHLFEKPLEDIAKIPDLEPKILSDLHKSTKNDAFIKAPMKPREKPIDPDPNSIPRKLPDENKWIWDLIEEMKAHIQRGIAPLADYEKAWAPYLEVLKMDPDEYVKQIEMADTPWEVDQFQAEISKVAAQNEEMRKNLPDKIQVSFF